MKKMKNSKAKVIAVFLVCSAILTSCGASYKESSTAFKGFSNGYEYTAHDTAASDDYYYDGYDSYDNGGYSEETVSTDNVVSAAEAADSLSGENIKSEMLVYSCTMKVDVLDFDRASEEFRTTLKQYQGFVETEELTDGASSSIYYCDEEEKNHRYTATVRVPSRVYEDFCDAVSELGDLRSKNASVENVSQEYKDLSTTLGIYEKKEERYLELLSKATDEANAVIIEDKLTGVQVEIAKLRTRMNQIKTDVAYSYVYVTIKEVKEYHAEPVKNDTFVQRLGNTLKDAGSDFLDFLEGLLFGLIYLAPYLVLLALAVLVLVIAVKAVVKKIKKRKEIKATKKAGKEMLNTEESAEEKAESADTKTE